MNVKTVAAIFSGAVCMVTAVSGKPITASEANNPSYFGTLNQQNPGLKVVNTLPIGPYACVPTATLNALTYLQNYDTKVLDDNPFNTALNNYTQLGNLATAMATFNNPTFLYQYTQTYTYTVNVVVGRKLVPETKTGTRTITLPQQATPAQIAAMKLSNQVQIPNGSAGGTYINNTYNGANNYLASVLTNPKTVVITGQEAAATIPKSWTSATGGAIPTGVKDVKPSANFLANALDDNDAVQIEVQWGRYSPGGTFYASGGAHALTLDYISYDSSGSTGTIGFLDPYGTGGSTTAPAPFTTTFRLVNNYIYFSYTNSVPDTTFGEPPGAGGDDPSCRVLADLVAANNIQLASVSTGGGVPDAASTCLLLGISLAGLAGIRRINSARR